jgi:hypothetical protein
MGEQLGNYFSSGVGQVLDYLPALLSGVVILVVGYFVSRLLGNVATRLFHRAGLDRFVMRRLRPGTAAPRRSASGAAGAAVFWIGILATLSLAAQALGLATLAGGLNQILAYVPRVLVAALIVGVAIAVANVLADLTSNVTSAWVGRGIRVAVITLSVFMALDQLGIARNIVTVAFIAVVGAAAVAAAIAFGVGSIDVARGYSQRLARRGFGERFRGETGVPRYPGEPYATKPGAPPPESPSPHRH